jgi:hypothetical protein
MRGDHAPHEIWRHGPRGAGFQLDALKAAELAHLFGRLPRRGFGRFALFGRRGEAIGTVAGQSLLGETMLFALVLRCCVLRCFTHFSILPLLSLNSYAFVFCERMRTYSSVTYVRVCARLKNTSW